MGTFINDNSLPDIEFQKETIETVNLAELMGKSMPGVSLALLNAINANIGIKARFNKHTPEPKTITWNDFLIRHKNFIVDIKWVMSTLERIEKDTIELSDIDSSIW